MFYNGDDEEQDFLSPTGGSKLASLFGMDKASSQGGNESLTYTAPKEPKKKDTSAAGQTSSASSLLLADVVFAYKYVDDKFASQGKVGAAVVANHVANDYKILLYITKDKPLAYAKISSTFSFVIQPSNYANFYDDSSQSWSVMFDNETKLIAFAKQVSLAKAMSSRSKLSALVNQDLSLGEGPAVEAGDSVEMKYTGWLLEDNTFGTVFESNSTAEKLMRLRVGNGKTIKAWEEGLLGMKKCGKRLVIAPPSFAYGTEGKPGKVPTLAVVIFELEIVRVKFCRDRGHEGGSVLSSSSAAAVDQIQSAPDADVEKIGSKISSDPSAQLPVKTDKAKLISRMAKMGQPMLPLAVSSATNDVTESEVPASPGSSSAPRPEVPSKPAQHGHAGPHSYGQASPQPQVPPPMPQGMHREQAAFSQQLNMFQQPQSMYGPGGANQISVYQPQHPMQYHQQIMGGYPYGAPQGQVPPYGSPMYPLPSQVYQVPPAPPPAAAPPSQDANLSMMMIETRQQNTEVRVSLSKVVDKMDRMGEKLDQLHGLQASSMTVANSMPSMEVGMLVQSIERIVKENERLKTDTMEKSARIEMLNTKIGELLQRNQIYIEQSNAMLEQRNDAFKSTATQSQVKVQSLEQEKVQYATELSMTTSQLASCQLEIATLKKKDGESRQQLERLMTSDTQNREELTALRIQISENGQTVEQATGQLKQETQRRKQLSSQVTELQETIAELTADKDSLDKKLLESKCKSAEERTKLETVMEAMKSSFEKELLTLKDRLKHEKNTTELTTAQQVTQLEEELNHDWKEKCDRLLSASLEKHKRELEDVVNEKKWLEEKLATMESKVKELKSEKVSVEKEMESAHEELEQLRMWKDKYDALRTQATVMKDKYEVRIAELEKERDEGEQRLVAAGEEYEGLSERLRHVQLTSSGGAGGRAEVAAAPQADVTTEVKKIMSTVYHKVRGEFSEGDNYDGETIHTVILGVIKTVTLEMIHSKEARPPAQINDNDLDSDESTDEETEEASVRPVEMGQDSVTVERVEHELSLTSSAVSGVSLNEKKQKEQKENREETGRVDDSKTTADIVHNEEFDMKTEVRCSPEPAVLKTDESTTKRKDFKNNSISECSDNQYDLANQSLEIRSDLPCEMPELKIELQIERQLKVKETPKTGSFKGEDEEFVHDKSNNEISVIKEDIGVDIQSDKNAETNSVDVDDWEDIEQEGEEENVERGGEGEMENAVVSTAESHIIPEDTLETILPQPVAVSPNEIEKVDVKCVNDSQTASDTSADHFEDFQETVESFEPDAVPATAGDLSETAAVIPEEAGRAGGGGVNLNLGSDNGKGSFVESGTTEKNAIEVEHIPKVKKPTDSDEEDLFQDTTRAPPPPSTNDVTTKATSKSVFDDDNDDDLFGFSSAQTKPVVHKSPAQGGTKSASIKMKLSAATEGTETKAKTKPTESDEETNKAPPPLPLFRDSDEEDNLDWLS